MELSYTTLDYQSLNDVVEARLWSSELEGTLIKEIGMHKIQIFPSNWLHDLKQLTVQEILHSPMKMKIGKNLSAAQIIVQLVFIKDTLNAIMDNKLPQLA